MDSALVGRCWLFLAALAAIFGRLPGTLLHPQFFAEDGLLLLPSVAAYYWIRRQGWILTILSIMSIGISIQIFSLARSVRHASLAPLGATPVTLLRS